jgi:HK97 gp10 family phage protein
MADQHIRGAESLNRKLSAIQNPMDAITKAMGKEIRRVRNAAVLLCPVNHGELRQSIRTDVKQEKTLVRGICYTNNQHAAYVEFGTGPKGEANHDGISPNVQPAYVSEGWWFPGDDIPPADADKYHWPKSESKDGKVFYYTQGQAAQPYMYPALKMNENIIKMNLSAALKAEIKKVEG